MAITDTRSGASFAEMHASEGASGSSDLVDRPDVDKAGSTPAPATKKQAVGVVLADGTRHEWLIADLPKSAGPRRWKSWVMDQLPYGTRFFGCRWYVR